MPAGRVCTSPQEAIAWMQLHGECIIKCNAIHGGQGVQRVTAPDEVRTALDTFKNPSVFLVQKFIKGPVGCTEMILHQGKAAAWFSSVKERTVSPTGPSVMRRMANPDGMEAIVKTLAGSTGFEGLCGFDWIQDETNGRVLLLEFHPRTPSGFGWGRYAGVDLPAALNGLLHGRLEKTLSPLPDDQLKRAPLCCHFPAHFWFALTTKRSDLKYWLPGAHAISWRNVPLDDPGALLSIFAMAGSRLFMRTLRRVKAALSGCVKHGCC
jgi:hypothetical protein